MKRLLRFFLTLSLIAFGAVDGEAKTTEPTPAPDGRALYFWNCSPCHGVLGKGGGAEAWMFPEPPPALAGNPVLEKYSDEALADWIREGQALSLEVRPNEQFQHAARTDAIYRYIREMPTFDRDKVDDGARVYAKRCVPCHDRYGHPVGEPAKGVTRTPRDLSDREFQSGVDDAELVRLVRHGKQGMPALVPRISKAAAKDLVRYVRTLSEGHELYDQYCARCHGLDGRGIAESGVETWAPQVRFDAKYFQEKDEEEIRSAVWHMLRAEQTTMMPHFGRSLSFEEIQAILEYLRALPD